MAKTKIVATLGPASGSERMLARLILAGVNVFRLNFSHGTPEEHGLEVRRIRKISKMLGRNVAVMQDLRGPKIRMGTLSKENLALKTGAVIKLFPGQKSSADDMLPVTYPRLTSEVTKGDRILLGDGEIELKVLEISAGKVFCRVVAGGVTASRKGINLPSRKLTISAITPKDRADLEFGVRAGVDLIALSFVRDARTVHELRRLIKRAGGKDIPIISKIESIGAIHNIDEIVEASDGVMVARGDLGDEVPLQEIPILQKMIIRKANSQARPVITATQMLKSMVENKRPTRAEVTDVANAIFDGTDAVMLSEETSVGKYPVDAVRIMSRTAAEAERHWAGDRGIERFGVPHTHTAPEAISFSAVKMAEELKVKAIITPSRSGLTARLVSRFRPHAPIIALSPRPEIVKRLALVWGVHACFMPHMETRPELLESAFEFAREHLRLKKGDRVIITAGLPIKSPGAPTNVVQIREIN